MYDRVLIPTDGSVIAEEAIEHALAHATDSETEIHVLHVMERVRTANATGYDHTIEQALRERGEESIATITDRIEATDCSADIETAIETGAAATTITDYADDHDIDLIVMGTHGRSGVRRVVYGSVTERVVRHSDTPVLTITID